MSCEVLVDDFGATFLCARGFRSIREPRKRCAFCSNRASVQCDGDRCVRPLCDDHRWSAAPELDFCPPCEVRMMRAAAAPKQIGLFG